ncbi:hypothetical protein GKZ68_17205 [Hymenobacter sp. BRD128]|uniref:hypothetical protein n=1 Tax=Hymenobacter sp. BRD128 TaxID=2675878 RepID=UPI001563F8D6|nr:hypothetical protein [Hymenobacter sp. BRD128]QKG58208.1 hypothetical protein GKZ68_17205 [Hymenobacter sp. BRD128]
MLTTKKLSGALLTAAATLLAGSALGQGLGNSPYSRIGLGDANGNFGGVRQLGMGGTGLAAPNTGNVNELNPALLVYAPRTTWEAAFTAQVKTVRNAAASNRSGTGTLGYLALAVPLNKRWGAAIGLKPYSTVDYQANTTGSVNGDPTSQAYRRYNGSGGLSEAYLATGIHVLRDFNIGGSASYLFGTITQSIATAIVAPGISVQQLVVDNEQLRYSDFLFKASAHYRHQFGKDLNLNLGAVETFQGSLKANRQRTTEQQDANGALIAGTTTVQLASDDGYLTTPALTQLGLSLDNGRNWSFSVDAAHQQWSRFRTFSIVSTSALSDTWRVSTGGEFTPDPGSVDHYFQRVTYRAGLSVAQMPYAPLGNRLYDRAVHWGFSFPLPTATPLESTVISLAFLYGVRGNTDFLYGNGGTSNVQEQYVRMQVGATLSNRWFIKRRLQ